MNVVAEPHTGPHLSIRFCLASWHRSRDFYMVHDRILGTTTPVQSPLPATPVQGGLKEAEVCPSGAHHKQPERIVVTSLNVTSLNVKVRLRMLESMLSTPLSPDSHAGLPVCFWVP